MDGGDVSNKWRRWWGAKKTNGPDPQDLGLRCVAASRMVQMMYRIGKHMLRLTPRGIHDLLGNAPQFRLTVRVGQLTPLPCGEGQLAGYEAEAFTFASDRGWVRKKVERRRKRRKEER